MPSENSPHSRGLFLDGKRVFMIPHGTRTFCVWSPLGELSPSHFFTEESKATAHARRMAYEKGHDFYVLGTESFHQDQGKVWSTYFGIKLWLNEAILKSKAFHNKRKAAGLSGVPF